jgi:hypothetical protein
MVRPVSGDPLVSTKVVKRAYINRLNTFTMVDPAWPPPLLPLTTFVCLWLYAPLVLLRMHGFS